MQEGRVNKAKQIVAKAKGAASRVKQIRASQLAEKKQKLATKLETAGKLKEASVGASSSSSSASLLC